MLTNPPETATTKKGGAQPPFHQRAPEIQPFGPVTHALPLLADTVTLRDLYKKYHWQVAERTFYQLHLLFDKHFNEQAELVDSIAERIQILGGVSLHHSVNPKGRSDMKLSRTTLLMLLVIAGTAVAYSQAVPPWSKGANNPAAQKGYEFQVADVDNVPDIHGNPADARLVIFIGGNQFFVPPKLITAFEQKHPELQGHIFYETLPPGILHKQIAADGAITLGNLTIQVKPDVYEAGARVLRDMEQHGQVEGVVEYATNDLEIMVPAGNPEKIQSLNDLARPDLRLSMPNPQWEGVANQIADSLRKAGGESLYEAVYQDKVKNGKTVLIEIHHRQTPMRIMSGQLDAGVTWASEVRFQQSIDNPIEGVVIPANQNTTAIYAGGVLKNAPHPEIAAQWLEFLKSQEAQDIYHHFGFGSIPSSSR